MKAWHWLVIMTIICWGAYVPTIHEGQSAIGGRSRALWALLFVGVAYVAVAIIGPLSILAARGDLQPIPGGKGAWISMLAGALGAAGAFGVILALMSGGKPTTVPPLVFAGAPVVATLIAMALHRPTRMPDWPFYLGLVMAASGAALVLRFKPQ
ncbi:MAG: hypothetical protein D6744_12700 [Planctomycetota bacterium]|nr:MAG: hypothetical protein D6744_12700 [Planctomycetota bacterium]